MRLAIPLVALVLAFAGSVRAEESGEEKKAVSASVELELYGTVKLDTAYNSSRANTGNFVRWVELDLANPDDDCFHMTANQTRMGLRISDGRDRSIETRGLLEIDFYGGGAENKPRPMLRHAYVDIEWPESGWSLLAGQTTDLFSPLNPRTLNYSPAWWAGNIAYRRPQLRVTRAGQRFDAAFAITRDIGSSTSDFAAVDSGTDAGLPGLQARFGGRLGPSAVGASGHWSREEFDVNAQGDSADFDSWSLNLDYRQALGDSATLQLELFTGENLAAYLGGIGNGINLTRMTGIASRGGWIAVDLDLYEAWGFHAGTSIDDPDDADLEPLDRSRNRALWSSADYRFTEQLQMGFELSYWATDYAQSEQADNFRGQFSVIYGF